MRGMIMFFEKKDINITDENRIQVEALARPKLVDYPLFHWVRVNCTNGTVKCQAEQSTTHSFEEFLPALESLKHSETMSKLAAPVAKVVFTNFQKNLKHFETGYAEIKRELIAKNCEILKCKPSNQNELLAEIKHLLSQAEQNYNHSKQELEKQIERLMMVMPSLEPESHTPGPK